MNRWLIPLLIGFALLALQAPTQAQAADSHLPVSVERIRAALKGPPPPRLPAWLGETPTFRVEVEQRLLKPIEEDPIDPTMGLPSVGELVMGKIEKLHSALVSYKRARAERKARKEVKEFLAAFCAIRECPAPDTRR